jgi:hypothetical protein
LPLLGQSGDHQDYSYDNTAQPSAWSGRGMARPGCISTLLALRHSGRAFGKRRMI